MRRETIIAVGIGVVAVALGAWYLSLPAPEASSGPAKTRVAQGPSNAPAAPSGPTTGTPGAASPGRTVVESTAGRTTPAVGAAASPTPANAGENATVSARPHGLAGGASPNHPESAFPGYPRTGLPTERTGLAEHALPPRPPELTLRARSTTNPAGLGPTLTGLPGAVRPSATPSPSADPARTGMTGPGTVATRLPSGPRPNAMGIQDMPSARLVGRLPTTQPGMAASAERTALGPAGIATLRPQLSASSGTLPQAVPAKTHVIQAGDTYTALAARYLGDAKLADLIAKANPGKDPRRLAVGAKLEIPPAPPKAGPAEASGVSTGIGPPSPASGAGAKPSSPATPATPKPASTPNHLSPVPPARAYTVQAGEGWYDLAKRFLKDGRRWPELYERNRERVSRDPKQLRAGTVIELPEDVALAKP